MSRHLTATIGPEAAVSIVRGTGIMTYDADGEAVDLLDHLISKRRRYNERRNTSQEVLPAIKMLVGNWYIDELGVLTRVITARDYLVTLPLMRLRPPHAWPEQPHARGATSLLRKTKD